MGLSPEQRVALTDAQIEHLVNRMNEFDSNDVYHTGDTMDPGYYAAIDRCIRLVKGEITDWTSDR